MLLANKIYEYNEISKKQWIEILQDTKVINEEMKAVLNIIYYTEHKKLNAKAIAKVLGYTHYAQLNKLVGHCGKRIKEIYDIPETEALINNNSWIVVFDGDEVRVNGEVYFNWILKDNMIAAIEQIKYFELPSIRILPMNSAEEFANQKIEEVQDKFFWNILLNRSGKYCFRKSSMVAPPSTFVLFQYNNSIIASATLNAIEKFEIPIQGEYLGAYHFDMSSIETFQPITSAEMKKIIPRFKGFSQAKQKIDSSYIKETKALINSKKSDFLPEEIQTINLGELTEGAKKQIIVNAYERSNTARKICLEYYGHRCCVCNFDFGHFYGTEFEGKIHVHHLKALCEINEEYVIDPINDLRPVCPNCHLALHSKKGKIPYTIEELQQKIENASK